jgi:hypothetical protein
MMYLGLLKRQKIPGPNKPGIIASVAIRQQLRQLATTEDSMVV